MRKKTLVEFFGNKSRTADALGVTKQAVNDWGPIVPRGIAFEAHYISNYALPVDRDLYLRRKRRNKAMPKKPPATARRSVIRPSA